ncbi:MAG TPA: DUF4870 domain-containing protein [Nocardioidaceae bacterium]|nr:DUF4870 domain-containing protein [Nocardioidaceae bacterium]
MTTGPQNPEQPPEPERGQPAQPGQPAPAAQPGQPAQPPGGYQQPPSPGGYQPAPPPAGYQSAPPMRQEDEKLWAIGAHLGPLVLGFIAPLIVWLVFRERSVFLDRHGKEALNFQIAYLVYFIVAGISIFLLIGFVLLPIVGVAWLVFMILAAVQASQYRDYRYPWIFRVVS